jgi:nicotinate-nucleotide adenylyltransferase
MRIVIYGGAFNPPHVSHLLAVQYLLQSSDFDQVWILPSYQHAFDKKMVSFAYRVEMIRLMIKDLEKVEICEIERELSQSVNPPKKIYTYDVLSILSERYPDHIFTLSIGADNLTEAHRWSRFEDLIKRWGLFVFGRIGHEASLLAFQEKYQLSLKKGPTLPNISSSEIRKTLSHHGSKSHLNFLILPNCLDLIKQLYTKPEVMLFGFGKAGQALKAYFEQYEKINVGVWSRSLGDLPLYEDIQNAIWLLCVNDDEIENLSERLYHHYLADIKTQTQKDHFLIGHLSGLHTDEKLKKWGDQGFKTFVMHPLQALRDEHSAKDLKEAYFAVTTREEQHQEIWERLNIFEQSKNRFFILPQSYKAQYHLSAVFTSNLSLILVGIGIDLMRQTMHCSEKEAREKLVPLLRSTMSRLESQSVQEALTGPVVRKDISTISKHFEQIKALIEEEQEGIILSQLIRSDEMRQIQEIYQKILLFAFRKDPNLIQALKLE